MALLTLGVVAAMDLVAGAAFLGVAWTVSRRPVAAADRLAMDAFVVWWGGMAAYMFLRAVLVGHAALVEPWVGAFLAGRAIGILFLAVAVWGLVFHIVYLLTGVRSWAVPLAFFYGAVGLLFYVAGFVPVPTRVDVQPWNVTLEGEGQGLLYRVVYATFGLSIIAAVVAYATLYPRVTDRVQKLRILLVSGGLLVWVASGLVAFTSADDLAKFVTLVPMGVVVAGAVTLAYHPPEALVAILEGRRPSRKERHEAMARRTALLV